MRTRHLSIYATLACFLLMAASCEKPSDEENVHVFPTRSVPSHISKKKLLSYVQGKYYLEEATYNCSDSLGMICYWNQSGDCTFELPEGDSSYDIMFDREGFCPVLTKYVDGETLIWYWSNMLTPRAVKRYWYYDEETGCLINGGKPFPSNYHMDDEVVAQSTKLIDVDDNYLLMREEGAWVQWGVPATYRLHLYKPISDMDYIAKGWAINADVADDIY